MWRPILLASILTLAAGSINDGRLTYTRDGREVRLSRTESSTAQNRRGILTRLDSTSWDSRPKTWVSYSG